MRKKHELQAEELAEIEKAIRQDKRAEVRHRAIIIRLLHLGRKPEEIAQEQMISVPTIYNWHKQWRKDGTKAWRTNPEKDERQKQPMNTARNWMKCWRKSQQTMAIDLPFGQQIVCALTWKKKLAFY